MNQQKLKQQTNAFVRQYTYSDSEIIAIDFGAGNNTTVDIVDGTAILVSPTLSQDQLDIDLPDGDIETTTNNGIVTIEVR